MTITVDDTKNWEILRKKINADIAAAGLDPADPHTWAGLQTFDAGALVRGRTTAVPAGYVGELISSSIPTAGAANLSSATATNITSISLTAGLWSLSGSVCLQPPSGAAFSVAVGWISDTSATLPTLPNGGMYTEIDASYATNGSATFGIATGHLTLESTTTIYLSGFGIFSPGGTGKASGFIGAVRRA